MNEDNNGGYKDGYKQGQQSMLPDLDAKNATIAIKDGTIESLEQAVATKDLEIEVLRRECERLKSDNSNQFYDFKNEVIDKNAEISELKAKIEGLNDGIMWLLGELRKK